MAEDRINEFVAKLPLEPRREFGDGYRRDAQRREAANIIRAAIAESSAAKDAEIVSLKDRLERAEADLDPPVCRLQFPDGSVPANAREAAEGWHREYQRERTTALSQIDALQREVIKARHEEQRLIDLWRSPEFAAEGRDGDDCNLSPCANAVNVLQKQRTRLNELRAEILEARRQFGQLCARLERGVRGEPGLWPDWVYEAAEAIRHAQNVPWLPDLLAALGWKGGTMHDALNAVRRLMEQDKKATRTIYTCRKCGGSGFSGRGTGYDDVCCECGGKGVYTDE